MCIFSEDFGGKTVKGAGKGEGVGNEVLESLLHFACGFVGKCEEKNAVLWNVVVGCPVS